MNKSTHHIHKKNRSSHEPRETWLLQRCSDPTRIEKSYNKNEKRYTVKVEDSLYKTRVKHDPYVDI